MSSVSGSVVIPDCPPLSDPSLFAFLQALRKAVGYIHRQTLNVGNAAVPATVDFTGILEVLHGGTGASAALAARRNLLAARDFGNVNDYLETGDTNYDDAFVRCLADKNHAYVPAVPALGTVVYEVSAPIELGTGQSITGDGSGVSVIRGDSGSGPVILLGQRIADVGLSGLTLKHTSATTGDHGVSMGQTDNDWVDGGYMSDVSCEYNHIGWNLGKAFACTLNSCQGSNNTNDGFRFTTTGNAIGWAMTSVGGPLQWILASCAAGANGHDGYAYYTTGTGYGGSGVGSSLGTLQSPVTYANGHHGIAAYGTSAQPLNSVRIVGGFIGEDVGHGIYLDTYGREHIVSPDCMELAGQSNIHITGNNADTNIQVRSCITANWWGIDTSGVNTTITGGSYINNGRAGTGVDTFSGIRVRNGSATVTGVTSRNFNSSIQQYGISCDVDNVLVTGCRMDDAGALGDGSGTVNGANLAVVLVGNAVGPIYFATGPTDSVVSGCFPASANTVSGGTDLHITGDLIVDGDTLTGTLHAGATAFTAGVDVTAGGMNFTTGVSANGITVDNVYARYSVGVGATPTGVAGDLTVNGSVGVGVAPSGTAGHIKAATIEATSDLKTSGSGQTHLTGSGGIAMSGGVTVSAGGMTFTTGVGGNGLTVDNINAAYSVGIGATPSGTAGQLLVNSAIKVGAATGGYVANSINVAGDAYKNNVAISGGGGFSGTYTGNVTFTGDLTVTGQIKGQDLWATRSVGITTAPDGVSGHIAGSPLAFTGASINMTGALAVTGNVQAQSLYATASLGVGTSPSGTTGRIDASTLAGISFSSLSVSGALSSGSFSTGSASVSSLSSSGAVSGASGSFTTIGAHTMTGNVAMGGYNISGVGDIGGTGNVFFTSGTVYGGGGVFTNADVSGTLAKSGSPYTFP